MKPLNEIYKKSFFGKRHKLHWRAPHVCGAINDILEPRSVIDVGCATGDLVLCWREQFGILSYGIEGSPEANEFFVCDGIYNWDLRDNWKEKKHTFERCFDLVTCFEVAEHIEPEYATMFLNNLTMMSNKILLSMAPPGQGGHYHVNCMPFIYWETLFHSFGYSYKEDTTLLIKKSMEPWKHKDGIRAFYNNLAFFEKRTKGWIERRTK